MADTKITGLLSPQVTTNPATDVLPIVNIADTLMASSGSTRKITVNQLLGAGGTATLASATITGDLTVDTSTLKVDSANNRVGIGTATPSVALDVVGASAISGTVSVGTTTPLATGSGRGNVTVNGSTDAILAFGIGGVNSGFVLQDSAGMTLLSSGATYLRCYTNGSERYKIDSTGVATWSNVGGFAGTAMTLNSTGLGVGVTPSAWGAGYKALQLGSSQSTALMGSGNQTELTTNAFFDSAWKYQGAGTVAASRYSQQSGVHYWYTAAAGAANSAITWSQAMTLDGSGNLLVGGTATATAGVVLKPTGTVANGKSFEVFNTASASNSAFYCPGSGTVNGVATGAGAGGLIIVNKDSGNLRSISAAGTINASGADYAEYMTKSGDFVIAKGDVAGIDANGNLTNVFADAVSFVVKSTDPSYVGNDKWGVDLEGDALEAARQLVDRIAFAGQVPVNVTGAKAGDYIVPVVNGTGIKGQAVSNPTFEQYQLAVGKVISIDADGRARIIVKLA